MYSVSDDRASSLPGFPIRTPPDQSLFSGSPKLFAAYHVLHRLPMPRHPPYALSSLTIKKLFCVSVCLYILTAPKSCLARASYQSYAIVKDRTKSVSDQRRSLPDPAPWCHKLGGGERVRTDGLLRARQALSQLSYTPIIWWAREDSNLRPHDYQSCALAS